jgi:hypothetical protein
VDALALVNRYESAGSEEGLISGSTSNDINAYNALHHTYREFNTEGCSFTHEYDRKA